MKNELINWERIPKSITMEQFYRLCHISKSTARFLLKSGKIPCMYTGKKTRCYRILKTDVIAYLADREQYPELYSASEGWYSKSANSSAASLHIPEIREDMHEYYTFLLMKYPDVIDTLLISKITGYGVTAINNWCSTNKLKHFLFKGRHLVPKVYLIDYFCSKTFRTIARKSTWHKNTLVAYCDWKYGEKAMDG